MCLLRWMALGLKHGFITVREAELPLQYRPQSVQVPQHQSFHQRILKRREQNHCITHLWVKICIMMGYGISTMLGHRLARSHAAHSPVKNQEDLLGAVSSEKSNELTSYIQLVAELDLECKPLAFWSRSQSAESVFFYVNSVRC